MFKFLLLVPVDYPWQVFLLAGGDIREKVETCLTHSTRASVAAVLCHLLIVTIHMTESKLENSVLTTVQNIAKQCYAYGDGLVGVGELGPTMPSLIILQMVMYMPQAIHCMSTFSVKHLMFFTF